MITSIGEILIDFLPIAEHGRTVGFRMHPGGSPFNVAIGLARLGQPTAFASKLANDFFGRYLREYASQEKIDLRFLLASDASTTLAFVAMEDDEPAYSFYRSGAADTLLTAAELPEALFAETRILHFGSVSLIDGSTPAAVLATAERLKGQALLSFDPNLRPSLVHDEPTYRALLQRLCELADLIKISAADLAWLMPGQSVEQAAADLLALGPALVVVTRGGAGVYALRSTPNEPPYAVPAFQIKLVDTVGAGDSFNGGLLAGLAARGVTSRAALLALPPAALVETLRFAAAVAAITCSRAGANPPTQAEVGEFFGGVGVA